MLGTNGAGKSTSIRMILGTAKDGGESLGWKAIRGNTYECWYLAEERGLYPKYALMDS